MQKNLIKLIRLLKLFSKSQYFIFGILIGWELSQLAGVTQAF